MDGSASSFGCFIPGKKIQEVRVVPEARLDQVMEKKCVVRILKFWSDESTKIISVISGIVAEIATKVTETIYLYHQDRHRHMRQLDLRFNQQRNRCWTHNILVQINPCPYRDRNSRLELDNSA
jgi:hypothetical protein